MTACFNNRLGVRGVCYDRQHRRYRATIYAEGRQVRLGFFKTIAEAREAYRIAYEKKRLTSKKK